MVNEILLLAETRLEYFDHSSANSSTFHTSILCRHLKKFWHVSDNSFSLFLAKLGIEYLLFTYLKIATFTPTRVKSDDDASGSTSAPTITILWSPISCSFLFIFYSVESGLGGFPSFYQGNWWKSLHGTYFTNFPCAMWPLILNTNFQ